MAYELPFGGAAKARGDAASLLKPAQAPLARPLSLGAHVTGRGGQAAQQTWMGLPLEGDFEQALLDWQSFSETGPRTPMYPYALFYLASLYGDSYALLRDANARDADILRSFGTEIARALLNDPLAPSYLRGLAQYASQTLLEGNLLSFRLARLANAPEAAENGASKTP